MSETLVQVRYPGVCAGLVVRGRCVEAAPILRRPCLGRTADELRALFQRRGWTAVIVPPHPEAP